MRYTRFTDESQAYTDAREALRVAEGELITQRERVAELRRKLPRGATVEDYVFTEGPADLNAGDAPTEVRLSELFSGPDRSVVTLQLMYGKAQTHPCPMCSMWLDGLNGVADHLRQRVDFVVVAAAELDALRAHGRDRGWDNLRLLSAANNTLKFDSGSEDEDGNQTSTFSVFGTEDGVLFHSYSAHPQWSDSDYQRGLDLMSPVWNIFDLTPQGRGDWYAGLSYDQ
jgi:predicted dithiol-disulfide oxidoreductase (DUF899 family)